ncbi:hypothetical protein BGZ70_009278 [Mortierella alpina]|uniref:HCP-like protein n=1 Tax=Mortierella alpina TaxID=64518 RepID=A0A9P6JDA6_MORAP|nr:hypothetical protein BGZ70_009278 [Mortierella alpina]
MLDLATAKAENITGLYFARQMNLKATSTYSLMDAAETTSVTKLPDLDDSLGAVNVNAPSSQHGTDGVSEAASNIRIKVSAPSPVVRRQHVLTDPGDGLHSASDSTRVGCPQPATVNVSLPPLPGISNRDVATSKRCRAATSSETLVSSLRSNNITSAAADPSFKTESGHVPDSPNAPPSASTRGQHRRSQSASHFFHLSSLKHHSPAQFNLALCYEHGQGGVERDLEKALHFYQQAADQGHTKASYNIGCICYNAGEVSKAMAWFESAGKCQWNMNSEASRGSANNDPLVEALTVEDALAERNGSSDRPSGSGPDAGFVNPNFFSAEPHGPDLHEAWSASLALQLLKAWTRPSSDRQGKATTTSDLSLDQKILRHHLLYITNPTHGKNLYNLGVLYDICLGERLIAARCYESAYRNSQLAADGSCRLYPALVTRINSAWNLGVMHAKHQDWNQAKCWFLKAQQDVLLHAQRQSEQDAKGAGKDQMRRDRTKTHTSLVNVFPGDRQCSPLDSPEKTRLREHGLMMNLSSFASLSKASEPAGVDKCKRIPKKQRQCQAQDGLETDVTKSF